EMLGLGRITGSFVPPSFDFALPVPAATFDPKKAKQLVTEAGYPDGFDARDITPLPPYTALGEAGAGALPGPRVQERVRGAARRVPDGVAREEAPRPPHRRDGRRGQRRRAARALRDEDGDLLVRRAARAGGSVRAAGEGAGPEEAGDDTPPDPARRRRAPARR